MGSSRALTLTLVLSALPLLYGCAEPTGSRFGTARDAADPLLGEAISAAGLVPDERVRVEVRPSSTQVRNGLLVPTVSVEVSNDSTGVVRAPQVLIVLRLTESGWVRAGCGVVLSVDPASPSGCDLEGAAQIEIPPGGSVDDDSPLPFLLDWPSGEAQGPGRFAVVAAFGNATFDRGAAASLEVTP